MPRMLDARPRDEIRMRISARSSRMTTVVVRRVPTGDRCRGQHAMTRVGRDREFVAALGFGHSVWPQLNG